MITDCFNELTKSSPEACFLLTPAGEILAVNPSCERMLGTGIKILAGQRIADLVTDPDDKLSRYMRICLRNRDPIPGALHWRTKEGQTIECRCSGHLIPPDPEADGRLILLRCEPKETAGNKFIVLNKTLEQLKASYHTLMAQSEVLKTEISERKRAEESLHKLSGELEQRVSERTAELIAKNAELEQMNRLFVGRELRMIELKERISELEIRNPGR